MRRASGHRRIIIDKRAITFMDCQGVAALITAVRAAGASDAMIALWSPPPTVRRMLRILGIDGYFPIVK